MNIPSHDRTESAPCHRLVNLTATEYKHLSQHLQVLRSDPAAADYLWTVCEDVLQHGIRTPASEQEDEGAPLTWDELAAWENPDSPTLQ